METDVLPTTIGDLPLEEVELAIGPRSWTIRHTGAILSYEQEVAFLRGEAATRHPYGIVLWPAAIALAHDLASRDLAGRRVLELGAGTGLPGIIAASQGAQVVQTDRQRLVVHVCKQNAVRNGITTIEHRTADWTAWDDRAHYDLIVGSDILYAAGLHPALRHIFETNLAPGGTVVLADPFRASSLELLEAMERDGWRVVMDRWVVERPVGVYALQR